ncbi:hypothetical protein, partial [Nocardia abscessus]|uniref:hypothetical protein n=1 Tax=Nocardia abscessus TaxID=120957 RepID=UPI002457ED67
MRRDDGCGSAAPRWAERLSRRAGEGSGDRAEAAGRSRRGGGGPGAGGGRAGGGGAGGGGGVGGGGGPRGGGGGAPPNPPPPPPPAPPPGPRSGATVRRKVGRRARLPGMPVAERGEHVIEPAPRRVFEVG